MYSLTLPKYSCQKLLYRGSISDMHNINPEQNPSHLSQEDFLVFSSLDAYYRALRWEAFGSLREHAENLVEAALPFSREIHEISEDLESTMYRDVPDKQKVQNLRVEAFGIALRTNVYSGVPLHCPTIWYTAGYVGVDKKWVRNAVRPTPDFIKDHGVRYSNKGIVRTLGHDALRSLQIIPRYGNRLMIILDARL